MEKISKEYYEKLKTVSYKKVETVLYDKLKDFGIEEVKGRIEEAEDHDLSYDNRIEYIKKMLKISIENYYKDNFTIIYNEELKQFEISYGKVSFPIPMEYIYDTDNEGYRELRRIKVSYKNEDFFINFPCEGERAYYSDYFYPPEPNDCDFNSYFDKYYSYDKDIKTLEEGTYCYEAIEGLMVIVAYILLRIQDPLGEKGFDLDSLELPENIGSFYIKEDSYMNRFRKKDRFNLKNSILSLINRFKKDELLAFILFAFDFNYYLNKKNDKSKRILTSPLSEELSKLSFKLLDIKDNDYVLNLYSELGDFAIESFFNSPNIKIRGIEDFYLIRNIAILKASLISDNINFSDITPPDLGFIPSDDPDDFEYITVPDTMRIETALEYIPKQKVDKIFSNLSLIPNYFDNALFDSDFYNYNKLFKDDTTINYRNYSLNGLEISKDIIEESSLEWLSYIKLMEEQLKDNGKAISLVEKNILYNYENRKARKYFIENGYIEAIILLPENIMIDVSNPLVFIIFSRRNKEIKFIDASSFGEIKRFKRQQINRIADNDIEKIINLLNNHVNNEISLSKKIEDFSENNYNLDVIENINPLRESKNGIKFKDVVKEIIKGSQINLSKLEESNEETLNMHYLTLSDVNDGIIEFENIKEYSIPKSQEKFFIENEFIILSKYETSPYKFAVAQIPYDKKEKRLKKVIASGNFIIIEVDKGKIEPWYLGALFSSYTGTEIFKKAYSGSKIRTLSIKRLEEIIIPCPPMEIQKEIGNKYWHFINEIEKIKKDLKDKIQSIKEIFNQYNMEV